MSVEIPYWWLVIPRSSKHFWLAEANFPRGTTNQKHYPGLEFLRSFLKRHFEEKPVMDTSAVFSDYLKFSPTQTA